MLISQMVSKLNEILSAEGDLQVDIEISLVESGVRQASRGEAHSVAVLHEEDVYKRVLISSDDGNAE